MEFCLWPGVELLIPLLPLALASREALVVEHSIVA